MSKQKDHSFLTDPEISDLTSRVDIKAILFDLKYLLKEYYIATFTEEGQTLLVEFNNGQKFEIIVREYAKFS